MALDIEKLKKELLSIRGEYQSIIKLQDKISFGTEIEFAGIELIEIHEFIQEHINDMRSSYHYDYKIWDVIDEQSVETKKNGIILGGEIVSPILYNDEKSWESLRKITCCFNLPGFYFSDKCSFHIHFGEDNFSHFRGRPTNTPQIYCDSKFISNLFKMWMVFEDVIYRTCYGSKKKERPEIIRYANATGYYIFNNLKRLYDEDEITKYVIEYKNDKKQGLNLCNLGPCSKNTIEIRCPNSMETLFLMQNTIKFLARLLLYCDSYKFDNEKIERYIREYKPMYVEDFRKEKFEKAKDLADMIYDDELDKMYFLKQYLKCFQQEELIDKPMIL